MSKYVWIFILLFLPTFLHAQVKEGDTLKVKAGLAVTGFYQSGNVDTYIFRARSDVSFKLGKQLLFKTTNSYVYQEFGKTKADEDILSLNFLYLNPDKPIHPLVLGFVSTNFRREIDLRYLLGGGFTVQLVNTKDYWLKLSITSEYEHTNFSRAAFNRSEFNQSNIINTLRGTFWMNGKYHFLDKKLILTHETYYQPSLQENSNYRWQADFGIEVPISKAINVKMNYLRTFESIVIANQKQEDRFLTFGINIKSY